MGIAAANSRYTAMTANQPNLLRYTGNCMPTANMRTKSTTASRSSFQPLRPNLRLIQPNAIATNVKRIEMVPAVPPA